MPRIGSIPIALAIFGVASCIYFANAGDIGHGHGLIAHSPHKHQDYYAYPKYKYGYGVKDGTTWDKKTAAEWRDGKTVKGHYSLQEPDGSWRIVNYVADEKGFRAHVSRTPHHH